MNTNGVDLHKTLETRKFESGLCVHSITLKSWSLEECLTALPRAGVKGITIWRQAVEGKDLSLVRKQIEDSGLSLVSYCRGGFFPHSDTAERQKNIRENLRAMEEAYALGAPSLVLVCGAHPGQSLEESRRQIVDGIRALLPKAEEYKLKLSIEPLHPMYAAERSAVNTLKQANDMCEEINHPLVGVAVDVYHLWWDPDLEKEIKRCGENNWLFAYHICDWKSPTEDMLNDRGLMGEGCIPIQEITNWVQASGFNGFEEVEIFSHKWWAEDPAYFLEEIIKSYRALKS